MRDRVSTSTIAQGRWPRILPALGIPRKTLTGKNGPCLFCGGKDRARFTDYHERGYYFCNQCGKYNGFELLMKYHGWTFAKTAAEVDRVIGNNSLVSLSRENYERLRTEEAWDHKVHKSTLDCALWLRKYHPEKLEDWLNGHMPEVRHWLETQL
jgi:phage/plasmid primase-like uncharacterized protein